MNKLTPYEQHLKDQLTDLPVPPVDKGWEQMEQLLNKKDNDRKPLIPFFSTAGCIGSMLLLGALVALFWIDPFGWRKNDDALLQPRVAQAATKETESATVNNSNTAGSGQTPGGSTNNTPLAEEHLLPGDSASSNGRTSPQPQVQKPQGKIAGAAASEVPDNSTGDRRTVARTSTVKRTAGVSPKTETPVPGMGTEAEKDKAFVKNSAQVADAKSVIAVTTVPAEDNASADVQTMTDLKGDSSQDIARISDLQTSDSTNISSGILPEIKEKEKKVSSDSNEKYKEKKNLHLAAGLTVYKGIPVGGAIDAAVNQAGRQNALSDYIPSVYLRLYKEQTWFVQAEFRYGVPQYTDAFMYKQNREQDAMQNVTTTSYKLRKTYYHQLPVSFNYFILPGWSVGSGVIYNRFKGAVSSESVLQSNARMVNDSLVSFGVVRDVNDSSFVKHTFQWLVETQYKYGRFSLGARYAQGLQPYIKYRDPSSGAQINRKNNSVYVFLRYELWRQRKN